MAQNLRGILCVGHNANGKWLIVHYLQCSSNLGHRNRYKEPLFKDWGSTCLKSIATMLTADRFAIFVSSTERSVCVMCVVFVGQREDLYHSLCSIMWCHHDPVILVQERCFCTRVMIVI